MRSRIIIFAALALAAWPGAALADRDKDFDDCWGDNFALRLEACPRLFEDEEEGRGSRAAARFNRARAFEARGAWDDAIEDYDQAIKLDAEGADYYFARARAYAAKGDGERELAGYTEAISRDTGEAEYRAVRGAACQAQGNLDGAIADFSAAIRLAPDVASAHFYRGDAFRLRGETDKAIADFSAAIERDPDSSGAWLARAEAYRAKRDNARAIADYGEAIKHQLDLAGAYFGRGLAQMAARNLDAAIEDFSLATALDPTNAVLRNMRGFAHAAKSDFDNAILDHTAAILIDPTDAYRYTVRAWAYVKSGKPALGLEDAERAVVLDANLAGAYATRAHIRDAMGKKDDAIADYRKAVALAPSMRAARDGLARLGAESPPEAVPAAAVLPTAPFDAAAYLVGLYDEAPISKQVFARRDGVAIRKAPDGSFARAESAANGDSFELLARIKPKEGRYCGVDSVKGWYKVRLSESESGYVRLVDVVTAEQQQLLEEKELIAKRVAEYGDKNYGSLKDFAGVYDGLKDCDSKFDESMATDGLALSIASGPNMLLKQVIWFDDNSMYSVRFSNPETVTRARLTFQRNFNLAEGGAIKLYRATYEKGNPETLGFYNDKLVISPKISGNRITYNYATRCDKEADMVEWANKIFDARIANQSE